jgi:uncharacterized protein YecE (DUF72 family)
MNISVGTSGWNYDWNPEKSLDWYVKNTKFNAIELNYSFYRFPSPKAVNAWKTYDFLSWSIKMNRLVTHRLMLNEKSYGYIEDFIKVFYRQDFKFDNLLFQLPPSFAADNIDRIIKVSKKFHHYNPVFEPRNASFFTEKSYKLFKKEGITLASIDSPLGNFYVKTTDKVYLRFHGRRNWYDYNYTKKQLGDSLNKIEGLKPKPAYIFFNNTYMFQNAKMFTDTVNKRYGNILHYRQ